MLFSTDLLFAYLAVGGWALGFHRSTAAPRPAVVVVPALPGPTAGPGAGPRRARMLASFLGGLNSFGATLVHEDAGHTCAGPAAAGGALRLARILLVRVGRRELLRVREPALRRPRRRGSGNPFLLDAKPFFPQGPREVRRAGERPACGLHFQGASGSFLLLTQEK